MTGQIAGLRVEAEPRQPHVVRRGGFVEAGMDTPGLVDKLVQEAIEVITQVQTLQPLVA